ncbi:protein-L-isoaspartate(D-aspartate) O-methyltransferase [Lentiprolixibacter aurantiacus]|uniref:Protein-L-isoaspartate O-methyltransferase n=1 Tax=Lentiprolixibacter aurantiacus TaxID=2993939 RepID=A0AAE3SNW8_9FLAO|nr:protein-L-isoaspartate(D-aspartate) O-methyltransferase [Lentiprolixibacter aurantiacus]MCX2719611.1 protein-L-isoaspartate(D-aspartate) O-methyltransferase [Lentiprolixibacter aurantiacus]
MLLRLFAISLLFCLPCLNAQEDYTRLRESMVNTQLKSRDIHQKATLDAMLKVPRHAFVPDNVKPYAYTDGPLGIGEGQTISQPYIVAFMTQALKLKKESRVLEVGTGSGYQAAVLGEIVDSVFTIEIVEPLGLRAKSTLENLGYSNVVVRIGDGYNGWKEKSPFDAIMVTAGAEEIPGPLLEQLKDGGSMIIPVGPHRGVRQLVLIEKKGDKLKRRNLMAVRFVPFTRAEE